jgi:hypothetical protein
MTPPTDEQTSTSETVTLQVLVGPCTDGDTKCGSDLTGSSIVVGATYLATHLYKCTSNEWIDQGESADCVAKAGETPWLLYIVGGAVGLLVITALLRRRPAPPVPPS